MNDIEQALTDLLAIVRDQQLGYRDDELHVEPTDAIGNGLEVLQERGYDPDEIVWPDDQETLGIDSKSTDETDNQE